MSTSYLHTYFSSSNPWFRTRRPTHWTFASNIQTRHEEFDKHNRLPPQKTFYQNTTQRILKNHVSMETLYLYGTSFVIIAFYTVYMGSCSNHVIGCIRVTLVA